MPFIILLGLLATQAVVLKGTETLCKKIPPSWNRETNETDHITNSATADSRQYKAGRREV